MLVVSYGSRASSMIDAFNRSESYEVDIYVLDKQRNPFNVEKSKKHAVSSDLDVEDVCKFVEKNQDEIDFGIVGPEKPIITGVRDRVEEAMEIPMICPTKAYAIEGSKVAQRRLFERIVPEVNPRFRVFDPEEYNDKSEVKRDLYRWLDRLDDQVVVKPDAPAAGKGVGVWGDHFSDRRQLFDHFLSNFEYGPVIVEEKIEGEESSFQAFCDGKHLVPLPETRDYKRAFDGDDGPNTGGMGSYKGNDNWLPFMAREDWKEEVKIAKKILEEWKGNGSNPDLRGMPLYVAFIHTAKGPRILENNSRPGDPEIQNIMPILRDDFVDVCFKILEENLTDVKIEEKATVVTYKIPPSYGGFEDKFPNRVKRGNVGEPIDLDGACELGKKYGDRLRIYPGSMELRNGKKYALTSRTVCTVGVGSSIQEAREISLDGLQAVKGGALWNRTDIALKEHIKNSVEHMERLRQQN